MRVSNEISAPTKLFVLSNDDERWMDGWTNGTEFSRSPISASAFFSSLSYPKLAEQKIPVIHRVHRIPQHAGSSLYNADISAGNGCLNSSSGVRYDRVNEEPAVRSYIVRVVTDETAY